MQTIIVTINHQGEKYPSIKISLVNGDMLNVWGYNAKEFIELINE